MKKSSTFKKIQWNIENNRVMITIKHVQINQISELNNL